MPHHAQRSLSSCIFLIILAWFGVVLADSQPLSAAVIPLGHGWEAVVPDDGPATTIEADQHPYFLLLHIDLTYDEAGASEILFRQASSIPYPTTKNLRIWQSIHNRTNAEWTGYNVDLIAPQGEAFFYEEQPPTLSPFFTVEQVGFGYPFPWNYTGVHFSNNLGPTDDMVFSYVDGRGGVGFPIGAEYQLEYPVDFTLRQIPIPEPAMVGLALGLAVVGIGRRRAN